MYYDKIDCITNKLLYIYIIGMKYAMISMKVILATLLRIFVFKVDKKISLDKIKLTTHILLSAAEPIKIKIEKRDLH